MTTKTSLPENLASAIKGRIDDLSDTLLEVSHSIHAHPELAFEERHAAGLLADTLDAQGLTAERGVFTLETAFEAKLPTTGAGPTVAILAEYDALPGIGHACGHNIIGTAATGAAAIIGHCYPVWNGFRGGKGVAASAGQCLANAATASAILADVS